MHEARSSPMITRNQVMPLLLAACPSFEGPYRQYLARWGAQEELLYVSLGELAHQLVRLQRGGNTGEFQAVFLVVERLHTEGDDYVREAASIGLLEDIQNIASWEPGVFGKDAGAFLPYLYPETRRWWDKLNRFWRGEGISD